jgi:hypothetical protein
MKYPPKPFLGILRAVSSQDPLSDHFSPDSIYIYIYIYKNMTYGAVRTRSQKSNKTKRILWAEIQIHIYY